MPNFLYTEYVWLISILPSTPAETQLEPLLRLHIQMHTLSAIHFIRCIRNQKFP